MIQGKENLITWLKENDTPYWSIKSKDGVYQFTSSGTEDNLSVDASIVRLNSRIDVLECGTYRIEATKTIGASAAASKSGKFITTFILGSGNNTTPAIGQIPGGYVSKEEISGLVQEGINKERDRIKVEGLEKEIKEYKEKVSKLEKENKELAAEVNGVWVKIIGRAAPLIDKFMPPATAAATTSAVGADGKNAEERLKTAFAVWAENEPEEENQIRIIECIANISKEDKGTYSLARGILLKEK